MSQGSEGAELRMLQQKAYGRDASLTDAEARRLRELEQRARPIRAPEIVRASAIATQAPVPGSIVDTNPDTNPEANPDTTPETVSETVLGTAPGIRPASADDRETTAAASAPLPGRLREATGALRRHWGVAAAASALLIVIGLGAGWAFFGQQVEAVALTGDQQQRKLELYEEGEYDEGSVRAVAQDDDALVWYATKSDDEIVCLVIDVGADSGQQCLSREESSPFGLSASVTASSEEESGTEVTRSSVNAYMMFSTTGEPMVAIQRWDATDDWLSQYAEPDRARADELLSDNQSGSLSMIGTFQDAAVWLLDRTTNDGVERCLIVDAADGKLRCLPSDQAVEDGISALVFVDDQSAGSEAWLIQVAYTVNQTPYLVITRDPSPASTTIDGTLGGDEPVDSATPGG